MNAARGTAKHARAANAVSSACRRERGVARASGRDDRIRCFDGSRPHRAGNAASCIGERRAGGPWFRENRDAARWFVWALTVATPVIAVMIALLRRLIPGPYRDVFLIGGVSWIVSGAVFSWTWAGLALHASSLEP